MLGLMLESKYKKITGCMRASFERQIVIEQSHLEQSDAINKFLKKRNSDLVEMNASKADKINNLQNEITALNDRLSNAVEGLSADEIYVLRANMDGNYIYRVTGDGDGYGIESDITVPKSLTNYDGYAKSETVKRLRIPWKSYKNLTAKRLTL